MTTPGSLAPSATSGDLLADRRYGYAAALAAEGDHPAAADLLRQVIDLAPRWAAAWLALGIATERMGDGSEAMRAYAQAAVLDPSGTLGAALHLARVGGTRDVTAMPPAYVAALFDDYAPHFDRHLVGALAYSGPAAILDALHAAGAPERWARALDLGCGTGLMGRAIRDRATHLAGVDLSPRMVAEAARSGCYDVLTCGDLTMALTGQTPGTLDLILAADVLVYCGALDTIVTAAAEALSAGGHFAFTVQRGEAAIRLGDDMRFSHSEAYLREILGHARLTVLVVDPVSTRLDAGIPVPGLAVVAGRP